MSSSSTLSSMTVRSVTDSLAHTPTLQLPPSPFLLFNTIQPLDRSQTAAKATTEIIPDQHPGPLSLYQTDQPLCCSRWQSVPTHSGSCFSHMDMPNYPTSPTRTVSQPSCPPAPKRQAPLTQYGGHSTSDSHTHVSNVVLPSIGNIQGPHRHLAAAAGDTAVSLRRLVANVEAVSTLQDMLGRLRQDTLKVAHTEAHTEVADSAGSKPAAAMPVPGSLETNESPSACQEALQAKRIKLFGHARGSFMQTHCFRSSSTEAPPVQLQRRPLTVQSNPPTVPIDLPTVQTDLPTVSDSDNTGHVTCHNSGLPKGAVALRPRNDSGFLYPHKVRRLQLPADITGRYAALPSSLPRQAADSPSSPTHGVDAEMATAPAPAAESKSGTGAPLGSPTLSGEGQSWPAVSPPTAVALNSPGAGAGALLPRSQLMGSSSSS